MDELPAPTLVTEPEQLHSLTATLARQPIIAVDTESNSMHAYREQVCLIQFSTPETDYLLDPLALEDLSPLALIFSNPKIEKVFHAAEYDLICLNRDFDFSFANLFDTMVAARILGRQKVGLGNILASEFGVQLKKRFQKANWGKRPLSPEMLSYARLDTHYLIPLRERLRKELKHKNRWPIAEEDFARSCLVNGKDHGSPEKEVWRMNGVRDLNPKEMGVLQELADYRRAQAEARDLPLFKVIGDKTLVALAAEKPEDQEALQDIPGMSPTQIRRHGKALLAALRRGETAKPLHRPRKPRLDDRVLERREALRQWRKNTARQMGVESDVILPRDLMEEVALENPTDRAALGEILAPVPWRLAHFGEQIFEVLHNM